MDGYFRDADSTAATVDPDGWLHTGDLGWFDSDGFLHYVGRSKQMLKVGGENVSALEVEGVLLTYPGVTAASVIGVSHPRLGEVPIAVVEATTPERELADRLMQHCHDRLARFKVPAEIVVVAPGEFPLTGSGKADAAGVRRLLEARS
jgi:acyl-CoA synthetase (AMP-forming)/AMP-acid ligase II